MPFPLACGGRSRMASGSFFARPAPGVAAGAKSLGYSRDGVIRGHYAAQPMRDWPYLRLAIALIDATCVDMRKGDAARVELLAVRATPVPADNADAKSESTDSEKFW